MSAIRRDIERAWLRGWNDGVRGFSTVDGTKLHGAELAAWLTGNDAGAAELTAAGDEAARYAAAKVQT